MFPLSLSKLSNSLTSLYFSPHRLIPFQSKPFFSKMEWWLVVVRWVALSPAPPFSSLGVLFVKIGGCFKMMVLMVVTGYGCSDTWRCGHFFSLRLIIFQHTSGSFVVVRIMVGCVCYCRRLWFAPVAVLVSH